MSHCVPVPERLEHPNIARLFDAVFAENGQPYLVLEHVVGTPVTAYCDERRLTVRQRLELFQQVLGAVQTHTPTWSSTARTRAKRSSTPA